MHPDMNPARAEEKTLRPRQCGKHDHFEWRTGLPLAWLTQVVRPVFFSTHRDYEVDATRVTGYEYEDRPCYCHYDVLITELRSDDDETWFMAPLYGEQLTGWRLIDDRWLIRRQIFQGEDCQASQSFFTFSGEMPR
ncbi:MAG: hypothetical protein CGU29_00840 [Candidatus Dactylopiibacterium carminicum]|uniref:Uncharacterized protein n=2 Tax=Candidatus Dactylopiibacterium carminicum TaxID=857335 RepID=A0A272EYA6_9RHOO|nr:MAG: hypothetical protein CGU29_00840 [Candidatus Dactylopiibacterium carminicum]